MEYQVTFKELPACTVYSARRIVPTFSEFGHVRPGISKMVIEQNPEIAFVEPEYSFNCYYNEVYTQENIDVELCQAVTGKGKDTADYTFKDIPAATAAVVMHKGPYSGLGAAHAFLSKWVEDNGYVALGKPREVYVDGIWKGLENPADWLTEIQLPVEKK